MKKILFLLLLIFTFTIETYSEVNSKKYNKIISLSMGGDEMVYGLVPKERILALSGNSHKNEMRSALWNKIDDIEEVHDNIEKVIVMEPDIVIAPDWTKKTVVAHLEEAGIYVYIYKTPRSFQEEINTIYELAQILEVEEAGEKIVSNMKKRLEKVQKKIKELGITPPRVLEYSHYGSTNGKGSMFDDMLSQIYITNVANEIDANGFAKLSKESVIAANPEIILIPIWDSTDKKECSKFFDFIKNDKSMQEIEAIKNGDIYPIPGKYIYMYSQYIIDGIEEIAKIIYKIEIEA